MLYKNSRYAEPDARDVMLLQPDGRQVRTLYRGLDHTGEHTVSNYTWRAGDRIDRVADRFLQDPLRYWEILDLNPEILNAHQIEPGTQVRIPNG